MGAGVLRGQSTLGVTKQKSRESSARVNIGVAPETFAGKMRSVGPGGPP